MFIWDGNLRNVCSTRDCNWIHHSIRVFEGDFTNPGDLDKIVDTCLGLWATAYYTHRLIVSDGVITPKTEHKSSFKRSATYGSYLIEALSPSKGDRHSGAMSDRNSAKIHPLSIPQSTASTSSKSTSIISPRSATRLLRFAESTDAGTPEVVASNSSDLSSGCTSGACEGAADFTMSKTSASTTENMLQRARHDETTRLKSSGACVPGSTAAAEPTPPASLPSEPLQSRLSPSRVGHMSLDERMQRMQVQETPPAGAVVQLRPAGESPVDASDVSQDSIKRSDRLLIESPSRLRRKNTYSASAHDNGGNGVKALLMLGRCSRFSKVSWRANDSGSTESRRTSQQENRASLTEILRRQRQSNHNSLNDPSREGVAAELKRRKITKEIIATELAFKSSNTIYDIVSPQKEEVFPARYFGNLVELLEACIDDGKIVPILRSQRNARLVESSLKRMPSTMKKTKRRLTRLGTAGRARRETQWPVLSRAARCQVVCTSSRDI